LFFYVFYALYVVNHKIMIRYLTLFFFSLLFCLGLAQPAEVQLLKTINGQAHPPWDKAMKNLSASVYILEPIVPIGITIQGYATKDRHMIANGYKSAIGLLTALAISTITKYSVDRTRPYIKYEGYIEGRDSPHTSSFPSGHTTAAFATATSLSLSYRKWYVTVPAYAYAGFVGYSRMRLGVHYPTDVLAGMVIGTGSSLLTWQVHKMILRKKQKLKTGSD
jgi:membrane-associated phospholipid phosphatase